MTSTTVFYWTRATLAGSLAYVVVSTISFLIWSEYQRKVGLCGRATNYMYICQNRSLKNYPECYQLQYPKHDNFFESIKTNNRIFKPVHGICLAQQETKTMFQTTDCRCLDCTVSTHFFHMKKFACLIKYIFIHNND